MQHNCSNAAVKRARAAVCTEAMTVAPLILCMELNAHRAPATLILIDREHVVFCAAEPCTLGLRTCAFL
jgi:hypothetical protein